MPTRPLSPCSGSREDKEQEVGSSAGRCPPAGGARVFHALDTHAPLGRFPASWQNDSVVLRRLANPERSACRQCSAMASLFSGALQLTDLDDFIGPSQVRRSGWAPAVHRRNIPFCLVFFP